MALYSEACLQEACHDVAFVAKALGQIARAKGMTQLSNDAGQLTAVISSPAPA